VHAYQPERLTKKPSRTRQFMLGLLNHPRLCVGATLSLAVIGAVFVNAIWYQTGMHPAPLFATRTLDGGPFSKPTAISRNMASAAREDVASNSSARNQSGELLREVQTALSVRGYYSGKLDGVYGSRTQQAITDFQGDHSLTQNGQSSLRLLTEVLLSASSRPQEVPVPKLVQIAETPIKVKTVKVSAAKPVEHVDGLVAQIQSGLRTYGYDDLVVDGHMGQQTATAIQRFQLDYGMKITGEPSDTVLDKLRDIGAYTQG
jgi:peptidoglycan hydrolase-like protein with peptidoglycan-binding domain